MGQPEPQRSSEADTPKHRQLALQPRIRSNGPSHLQNRAESTNEKLFPGGVEVEPRRAKLCDHTASSRSRDAEVPKNTKKETFFSSRTTLLFFHPFVHLLFTFLSPRIYSRVSSDRTPVNDYVKSACFGRSPAGLPAADPASVQDRITFSSCAHAHIVHEPHVELELR